MIEDRIKQIEAKLNSSQNIPDSTRQELLQLLTSLRSEVGALSKTHAENADIIARSADASTEVVTGEEKRPELVEAAIRDLNASVEGFEASHPTLVQVVNRIAVILSNMGI